MQENKTQQAKANSLKELHHTKDMLVLPNIWNPIGALLIEHLGFPAVATASASLAISNGYDDGENIPFNDLLHIFKNIVEQVSVPVTADIESGYAADNHQLEENIKKLIGTGLAGINFEDSNKQTGEIVPVDIQCEKIQLIRRVSVEMNIPLFINARADVYVSSNPKLSAEDKMEEALRRGRAYMDAGADCFFPIGLRDKDAIQQLVSQFPHPVNILAMPGVPDLKTLKSIGVTRLSTGPGLLGIALRAMKETATRLQALEGLDEITTNTINMDFMRKLIASGK